MEIFIVLGIILLAIGVYGFVGNRQDKKKMEALGIDADAWKKYEQERDGERARRFGRMLVITDHWVYCAGVLIPLDKIAFFEKGYANSYIGRGGRFYVKLMLGNGMTHELSCEFSQLDEITALLAERCPQANARPMQPPQ